MFVYRRCLDKQELLVINNLSEKNIELSESISCEGYQRLLGNYPEGEKLPEEMRAYESLILCKGSETGK